VALIWGGGGGGGGGGGALTEVWIYVPAFNKFYIQLNINLYYNNIILYYFQIKV
jgi:hypothetical protein